MEVEKKETLATFRLSTDLHNWFKDYAKRHRTTMTQIFTEILLELQQKDMEKRGRAAKQKLERLQKQISRNHNIG